MSANMVPAIILGSHVMGLAVARALGAMGVPIVAVIYNEREEMGHVSSFVSDTLRAPHPEKHEQEFVDALVTSAARFGGGVLLPTSDEALVAVSRHKTLLERSYRVACTEWCVTESFINKKNTYAVAEAIGVPAPKTVTPKSVEEVEAYARTVRYPCLVKPCQSHSYFDKFKRKMVCVDNLRQLVAAYREAADAGLETMLQEWIPGEDAQGVNYNSYFWGGEALTEFTAQKVRNSPPKFGSPRVAVSKHIPEVLEPGRRILRALGFSGYSCTEFKKDLRDGVYKLMEVNGRHNRSGLLAVRCGINFPWLQYRHLVYGELPGPSDFQEGIYWIDILRDISYSLKYFSEESYSLKEYLRPYRRPHVFAIWDRKDPKPFLLRTLKLARRGF